MSQLGNHFDLQKSGMIWWQLNTWLFKPIKLPYCGSKCKTNSGFYKIDPSVRASSGSRQSCSWMRALDQSI